MNDMTGVNLYIWKWTMYSMMLYYAVTLLSPGVHNVLVKDLRLKFLKVALIGKLVNNW